MFSTARIPQFTRGVSLAFATAMGVIASDAAQAATTPTLGASTPVLSVTSDYGGSVIGRYHTLAALRLQGTRVEVKGQCMSACTMYLGLPNTCVSPQAIMGFHGPRPRGQNAPTPNGSAARLMAAHYPPKLRQWFMETGQYIPGDQVARFSGDQLVSMGVKRC